ncbi:MAG TPA: heat-inducible transcriptional repressor HrcA [Nitrospiria bacterium]
MELADRHRNILKAVIATYIELAIPVGSATLTKSFPLGLSPATIRNIMAELEELGYLWQPHTSAGRIPTQRGYRLYVDELMGEDWPSQFKEDYLEEHYLGQKRDDVHALLQEATRMLSNLSHYAGVVLAPSPSKACLERLEFILLRRGHVLAVQVSTDGVVQHRVIEADPGLVQEDLTRINTFINERFGGRTLQEFRAQLLDEMKADKELYDRLLQTAMTLARKALEDLPQDELYVGGASNIFNLPDFAAVPKMKVLFHAFEEKATIVDLLNRCIEINGVQILIGSEVDHPAIHDCSLVISTYKSGAHTLGILGVIGPTRMEYDRVIPLVDHTAKLVGRLLEKI